MTAARQEVVVVGAGVAGLAAATSLVEQGADVTLLERRPFVGGRAYSYEHPALQETVDSQHVMVGCCTNLIEFCAAAGLAEAIRWYDRQTFLDLSEGHVRASTIEVAALPAPMQYAGSFARAGMLGLADKAAIARGLSGLLRGYPAEDTESVASWYVRTRQTEGAIRHFWEPVVLATLNDGAANCSMKYAGKVFHELFLKTRTGGRLGIPTLPLSEFYAAAARRFESRGGRLELRSSVDRIAQQADGRWLLTVGEEDRVADSVVLALPFEQTQRLVAGMAVREVRSEEVRRELVETMTRFVHSPFLSILLWYDREITDLHHAWLLDTTIQWFFHKSRIRRYAPGRGSYVELVIAGSRRELGLSREQILAPALAELARFFPKTAEARLLKSGILKEARATFSVMPGMDAARPGQRTGIPGLFLAGDWTATEWPSTMEGAARSGRLAAGEVVGEPRRFLAEELPASGLMRWVARPPGLERV
ncbi:MAG: hydroxysqualene dehydroxylase HpnE [Acidobacteriota bacterium]|nr:hydroxysqualene dehydroxylase HpnE [Acidobacteriota bacterium]